MMETRTSFTEAHLENQLWANELDFYREEIGIFEKHLEGMVSLRENKITADKASVFQNQFARFRDRINLLEAELNAAQVKMAQYAKDAQKDLDAVNVGDHYQFRQKVEQFKKEFETIKQDYKNFESQE
jgi:uncharacterized protein (UPF0335 family)